MWTFFLSGEQTSSAFKYLTSVARLRSSPARQRSLGETINLLAGGNWMARILISAERRPISSRLQAHLIFLILATKSSQRRPLSMQPSAPAAMTLGSS